MSTASAPMPSFRSSGNAFTARNDPHRSDFTFRRLRASDLILLDEWIRRPHVAQWWLGESLPRDTDATARHYRPTLQHDSYVKPYIASLDDEPVGFIQSYVAIECGDGWWADETDPGVVGVDQFLADEGNLGRGLGARMVSAFVRCLFRSGEVTKVQTDPHPANARAIRCYEKVGFRRVRNIETPDGPALLMVVERPTS